MKYLIAVFIGGGLGSVFRFLLAKWLNQYIQTFPFGTFIVNIVGSFLIGVVIALSVKSSHFSQTQYTLLAIGFCGGFTTFSAFAYENFIFLKNGDYLTFFSYAFGSIILGLAAVFAGLHLAE